MNKMQKSFLNKYGEDLRFTRQDQQHVLGRIEPEPNLRFRKPVFWPAVSTVLAICIACLVCMHWSGFPNYTKETEQAQTSGSAVTGKHVGLDHYTDVNQTVDKDGFKVTVEKILYDSTRASVIYSIESDKPLKEAAPLEDHGLNPWAMDVEIGNLSEVSSMTGYEPISESANKITFLEDRQIFGEVPDEGTAEISIKVSTTDKGPWTFTVPVKKDVPLFEGSPETVAGDEMHSMRIKRITFAPGTVQVIPEIKESHKYKRPAKGDSMAFEMTDSNGEIIEHVISGATGGNGMNGYTEEFNEYYKPVKELPKSVTIQAYAFTHGRKEVLEPVTSSLPVFLKQDGNSGITVSKIQEEKEEIWIFYEVEGSLHSRRAELFLIDKNSGKQLEYKELPQRLNSGTYLVKIKGKLQKNLMLGTRNHKTVKLEDYKIEVPLK